MENRFQFLLLAVIVLTLSVGGLAFLFLLEGWGNIARKAGTALTTTEVVPMKTGKLEQWIIDPDLVSEDSVVLPPEVSESHRLATYVRLENGERYLVHDPESRLSEVPPGVNAHIAVQVLDAASVARTLPAGEVRLEPVPAKAQVLAGTLGEQKIAIILASFGTQIRPPLGLLSARRLPSQIDSWVREVSGGKAHVTADVFGWYRVERELTCNNFLSNIQEVVKAADGAVNFAAYDRLLMFYPADLPVIGKCPLGGISSIGKIPLQTSDGLVWVSVSVVNAHALTVPAVALRGSLHELGHGFGLRHADALDCGTRSIPNADDISGLASCTHREYGNPFDIMGISGSFRTPAPAMPHFNGYFKELLGWIDKKEMVEIPQGTNTYFLAPLETTSQESGNPKILKIARHNATGRTVWYYVEYRAPLGSDRQLAQPRQPHKILVSRNLQGNVSASLLDLTPQTDTFLDAAIGVSGVFEDHDVGLRIAPVAVSNARSNNPSLKIIVTYTGIPE